MSPESRERYRAHMPTHDVEMDTELPEKGNVKTWKPQFEGDTRHLQHVSRVEPDFTTDTVNSTSVLQPAEVSAVSHQCSGGPHREDRAYGQPAYSRPMTEAEQSRYYAELRAQDVAGSIGDNGQSNQLL